MVYENKLGITTKEGLSDAEERIGKFRTLEMFDSGALTGFPIGTYAGLKAIHTGMFGDIYASAGQLRKVDTARGNIRFTPVESLATAIKFVDIMPQSNFDDVVDKFIEMNIVHPFLHGNGPALRLWLNEMLYSVTGTVIDYGAVSGDMYRLAMEKSSMDDTLLHRVFSAALTRDAGRAMFIRCVDASFAFDGYTAYKTEFLRRKS